MLYQRPTFTCPTTARQMTDEEYEIAVGSRCAHCRLKEPFHAHPALCADVFDPAGIIPTGQPFRVLTGSE